MPNQTLPIAGLADVGLIEDMPSVALPPNAFSDVNNVRFRDGAIRKFPGDETLLGSLTDVVYTAYWPSPSGTRYIAISDNAGTSTFRVYDSSWSLLWTDTYVVPQGTWQHTLFNGGFHIVFNNTKGTPVYLQDGETTVTQLPGWNSYAVEVPIYEYELDGTESQITILSDYIVANAELKFTYEPRSKASPIKSEEVTITSTVSPGTLNVDKTLDGIGTVGDITVGSIQFTPVSNSGGGTLRIVDASATATSVTAGVLRAYNNLLVAADLEEIDVGSNTVRKLSGLVRTSDVAAPGVIPQNWNPFALGVNTADEFILASTGRIMDMATLQGVLYIYTDSSIHAIQQTNSPVLPFQISTVTSNYGIDAIGGVVEVDGKHIAVGSNDCYVFAGHPGSITSIADGRTRNWFRSYEDIQVVRYNKYDELWFWRSNGIYVWNYRTNIWTKRDIPSSVVAVTASRGDLLLSRGTEITGVDNSSVYMTNAFIDRRRMTAPTEFDTETVVAITLLMDGSDTVTVNVDSSNIPNTIPAIDNAKDTTFTIATDYKQDIRETGRFIHFRLTHTTNTEMNLSGISLELGKGGRR